MKKLTTLQVIVIIVLAAIVLFLPLIWKGGPSGREVNAALKLRWAQVEGQRINYMSRHNPRASLAHGPVDIKKNVAVHLSPVCRGTPSPYP